jgi:outer membrane receptor protein involved in Fe transport
MAVAVAVAGSIVAAGGARRATAGETRGEDFDDLSLNMLLDTPAKVWTATKTEQNSSEAPAIITTVTREQIAVWGYRSVAEVLSHLLGFYVVDDHTSTNLAVRGISGGLYADSSIVKVMIDGQSVAFHSTGGNWLGPELLPLSAIERIEIIRGPASALFGADAFLGVINIKTRTGKSLNGANAWVGAGMAGQKLASDVDLSAGTEVAGVDVMVALRRSGQDLSGLLLPASSPAPTLPSYNRDSREAHGLDQVSTSALARVTYRPRSGTELGVFGYYSALERGAEFGSLVQLANGRNDQDIFSENRVSLSQLRGGLFLDQEIGSDVRLSLKGQVFRGAPGDDNRLEVGSEYYYVRRQFGFRGADLDGQVDWTPAFIASRSVRMVAGASLFADDELLPARIGVAKQANGDSQAGDIIPALTVRQPRKTLLNSGAYLQGMWSVIPERLNLTGGLRYDHHTIYGDQLNGRVGLVSSPLRSLHAKLLYGSAFKAPPPILLYAIPSAIGDIVGNPELRPQSVNTGELQLVWEPWEPLSLSSSVAYSVLRNQTEFVQQEVTRVARNVARSSTLSWESMVELKYQLVRAHVSFETQHTVRRTGEVGYAGDVLGSGGEIYPKAMVHGAVVAQVPRLPLRTALQLSYIGVRRPSDTNVFLNGGPYELPSYLMLEAGLSTIGFHPFGRDHTELSFSLNGKNLLQAKGPTPGFSGVDYPLAPRMFFLQMNLVI